MLNLNSFNYKIIYAVKLINQLIVIVLLCSCEYVIKEFEIKKIKIIEASYIKDSLILNKLIISNDIISGWEEDKKTQNVFHDSLGNARLYTKNDLFNIIYSFENVRFYIIDTIYSKKYYGILILKRVKFNDAFLKTKYKTNYDETLFLLLFNENNTISTLIIAKDYDTGVGTIGVGEHIKSELTNKNMLINYRQVYGFLDIGNPPYIMDSIITKYNLNSGRILSVDTVKSIKPYRGI